MRRKDTHDYTAERLVDEYQRNPDDDALVIAIAKALRVAAGVTEPRQMTRAEYDAEIRLREQARRARAE